MAFVMPHIFVLVATGCMLVSLIFQLIGNIAVRWVSAIGIEISSGLWRTCYLGICLALREVPSWFEAVRAFAILGLLASTLCLLCVLLLMFKSEKKIFVLLAAFAAAAASIFSLIEFAVFADKYERREGFSKLDYCFVLTIVAFVLSGVAAVLFVLGKLRAL